MDTNSLKIGKKLALTLRKKIGDIEIIIFGSRVRDDYDKFSDIDVCLIVKNMSPKVKEKIFNAVWKVGFEEGIVISPLIFTKKEWIDSPITESPIHKVINKEGIKIE